MCEGFLISITGPFPLDKPIRVAAANLRRSIRAERVDHHDLIAPAQTLKTIANALFLIEAHDDSRDRIHL
jgi:hypothetical protein